MGAAKAAFSMVYYTTSKPTKRSAEPASVTTDIIR